MPLSVTTFWLPKAGNTAEEYEDSFGADPERGCFAVADGASETMFAAHWARQLTDQYVLAPPEDGVTLEDWVRPLQDVWSREYGRARVPWYAEEKLRAGAYAALLGMTFDPSSRIWRALAIGDSCFVMVRRNKAIRAFPLQRSTEFHNRPLLISSVARSNTQISQNVRIDGGEAAPGDIFFLMTDALAEWFLKETELRRRPWAALHRVQTEEQFAGFLELLRTGGAIRNDDVTLVSVEVS